jgi:hypothetical protein
VEQGGERELVDLVICAVGQDQARPFRLLAVSRVQVWLPAEEGGEVVFAWEGEGVVAVADRYRLRL